ncbi:MAG: phosphoribosylaminoimidazolesuccinocarboxamide synthase [Bacteriovoracia bacterium]
MSDILIHRGSTKDVYKKGNNYLFRFSDRYSVFDWGEMPDLLDGKGIALARFTKAVYSYLEGKGIKHHLINETCRENEIIVRPFEVIRDSSALKSKENVFIPLEVIFRMGVAKGSSLLKRFNNPEDWQKAGLGRAYQELEMFGRPVVEFTTKLERFDRPLTHEEAKELSKLSEGEWTNLLSVTVKIAESLKELFSASDITLWDGKIELAAGEYQGSEREIILVDSIAPDELRLSRNGVQLSKEVIRQYYRNSSWYHKLDEFKHKFGPDFKEYISPPPALTKEFKTAVEDMYGALAGIVEGSTDGEIRLQKAMAKLRSSI